MKKDMQQSIKHMQTQMGLLKQRLDQKDKETMKLFNAVEEEWYSCASYIAVLETKLSDLGVTEFKIQ